jgi:adenosylcobyric acid synthase
MIQGTGSDVGKSLLVAGLCRLFRDRGLAVRPFKPQNMSNNAAVADDGGEIGRAQALQARAARIPASIHMNPILLKPESETGSQVVAQGQVVGHATAKDYYAMKPRLLERVMDSYRVLGEGADLIVIEGAGSAAEINLRANDIANMGFAVAANVPVVLCADIDRGGVIAQIVGTWAVLAPEDRDRVAGFVINKFRGDPSLFIPAITEIERRTGWKSFGLIPFWPGAKLLPPEDSASLAAGTRGQADGYHIAIPMLSRIANFDDFDPLATEPGIRVTFVKPGQPIPADADLIILPGTKSTIADLAFVRAQGWDIDIVAHARQGKRVLGICGGYQMLGTEIADPDGVEGPAGETVQGLGLLQVSTIMAGNKVVRRIDGLDWIGRPVQGYEIHMGRTSGPDCSRPMLTLDHVADGAINANGTVMGCYLHGLFDSDRFRAGFLGRSESRSWAAAVDTALDDLARHLAQHVDVDGLLDLAKKS